MLMQIKGIFEGATEKRTSDGRKIFKGVASSLALDRHREVVVPKGVNLTNFLENPVLMRQHEHREEPIGMLTSIDPNNENIPFEFVFDEADPEAARIMGKVERGMMKTFSIGFLPTKWVDQDELVDETGKMLESVELDVGDNTKYTLDMSRYKATPRRVYTQWELLEVSLVSIPANPEAQVRMIGKELVAAHAKDSVDQSFMEAEFDEKMGSLASMLKEFVGFLKNYGVIGLAIAVIIGGKLNELVTSVVNDLLMPLLLQPALRAAQVDDIRKLSAGGVLYGKVLGASIDFLVVALIVFLLAKMVLREETVTKK